MTLKNLEIEPKMGKVMEREVSVLEVKPIELEKNNEGVHAYGIQKVVVKNGRSDNRFGEGAGGEIAETDLSLYSTGWTFTTCTNRTIGLWITGGDTSTTRTAT